MDKKDTQDIASDIAKLKNELAQVIQNQTDLKKEIHMIFTDITHFENLVLKILDKSAIDMAKDEFHH